MSARFIDPYVDPNTHVLKNLVGAQTYDELRNAEGEFVATRISEFVESPPFDVMGTLQDFA